MQLCWILSTICPQSLTVTVASNVARNRGNIVTANSPLLKSEGNSWPNFDPLDHYSWNPKPTVVKLSALVAFAVKRYIPGKYKKWPPKVHCRFVTNDMDFQHRILYIYSGLYLRFRAKYFSNGEATEFLAWPPNDFCEMKNVCTGNLPTIM